MALQAAWLQKKAEIFAGKYHIPDPEDPDTVSHLSRCSLIGSGSSLVQAGPPQISYLSDTT
jgi:hypothetical protein